MTGTVTGSVDRVYDNDFRIDNRSINGGNIISFGYDNDSLLSQAGSMTIGREVQKGGLINGMAKTWAQRLKRVFNIDVETCDYCGGSVKVIAYIEDQAVIDKILSHLEKKVSCL